MKITRDKMGIQRRFEIRLPSLPEAENEPPLGIH